MAKPKVISLFKLEKYESRFLNIPMMGKPVDLFLECLSYDLKIPVNGTQDRILDIFEETVLKMINVKKCSKEEMSEILCLPKDLVNFILIRLDENGYLEDALTLSQKGKSVLEKQQTQKDNVDYIHGKLFMIKDNGLILPYVYKGEFRSEDVIEYTNSSITLGYGSAGNLKKVYGKCIRSSNYDKSKSILSQGTVQKAISIYNKLAANKGREPIQINRKYGIETSSSDRVYFHLQAVVQRGNVDDLLISDGFVSNIDGVADYLEKKDSQLLYDIKKRAVSMKTGENEDGEIIEYKPHKYDEVVRYYYEVKKYIGEELPKDATIDELKEQSEKNRHAFVNCYSLLEWAFYYYTKKNPLSEKMLNFLKKQNTYANAETIIKLVKKLGIKYTDKYKKLFTRIEGSRIKNVYESNKPNLYICLPLAIAEASENTDSKIYDLIKSNSYFLSFLYYLNNVTGDLRHDSMKDAFEFNGNVAFEKTMRIVTTLLPDLEILDGVLTVKQNDNISEMRLLAQVNLERAMGSIYFTTLHDNIKNEWMKISPDKFGQQLPEPYEYLQILSRLNEAALFEALNDIKIKRKYSKGEAVEIITNRYGKKIPKSLSRVNEGFYRKVINGEKATLGAYALAYLTLVDKNLFKILIDNKFMQLIDNIASLREHANNIALIVDESKLNDMRNQTMIITKIIGGYYG